MEPHLEKQHSLKRFQATVAWQNRILELYGIGMYSGNPRVSYRILPICILSITFVLFSVYSAVHAWGDMGQIVLSIVFVFYAVVGITRLAVGMSDPAGCYRSIQLAEQMYARANGSHPAESGVLAKYTDLFCKTVQLYTVFFTFGVLVIILLPFGMYFIGGERILAIEFTVPFIDKRDPSGFWYTVAAQLVYLLPCPWPLVTSQNVYFAFVFNICLQYELLMEWLKQLDEKIRHPERHQQDTSQLTVRDHLVQIIQFQQQSTIYIAHIDRFYHLQSFVEFLCNALQVALTLTELHRHFWLPGIFIIPVAVGQMLLLCSLGTLIELKSDQFADQLYDIAWSEMSLSEQAMFKYVLHSAQQPTKLTCGGFAVINMNLFLSIHKKIYSFFMMLQNV